MSDSQLRQNRSSMSDESDQSSMTNLKEVPGDSNNDNTSSVNAKTNTGRDHDQGLSPRELDQSDGNKSAQSDSVEDQRRNRSDVKNVSMVSSPDGALLHHIAGAIETVSYDDFKRNLAEKRSQQLKAAWSESSFNRSTDIESDIEMEVDGIKDTRGRALQECEDDQPQTMNLTAVWQMFRELKGEIKEMKKEQKKITEQCVQKVTDEVISNLEVDQDELVKVKADLAYFKYKSQVLSEVCQSLHIEVSDLTQKIEGLELSPVLCNENRFYYQVA